MSIIMIEKIMIIIVMIIMKISTKVKITFQSIKVSYSIKKLRHAFIPDLSQIYLSE